jgi:hypothetical protein
LVVPPGAGPVKQTESIRVVVFTGGAELQPDVLDFVGRLEKHLDIELVGVFCQTRTHGFLGIASDLWKRRGFLTPLLLLQRWLRIAADAVLDPRRAAARRWTALEIADRLYFCPDLHSGNLLDSIRELNTDLGLVYGGPVLRPELYSLPRLGSLGIHHGLTPGYRGKKTTFWAIYNGEENVGVTIQKIGDDLDRGAIVAEGQISIGRAPLPVVTARLRRLGLDLYLQAVLDVRDGTAVFRPQVAGTSGLYRDPSTTDILRFWWRYFARLIKRARRA